MVKIVGKGQLGDVGLKVAVFVIYHKLAVNLGRSFHLSASPFSSREHEGVLTVCASESFLF